MIRRRHSLAQARAQARGEAPAPDKPRRAPRLLESAQGMALVQWANLQARAARPCLQHLFHVPNGGARSRATAGRLKAEGVRRGTWDYFLPVVVREPMFEGDAEQAPIRWPGLWIELKVATERNHKDGGLSEHQVKFGSFIHAQGYATVVAYTWEEARDAIVGYLDGKQIPFFWSPKVSHGTH